MNKNISVKIDDEGAYLVSVAVSDTAEIKMFEEEAQEIADCLAAKAPFAGKGWKFAFAPASDDKPDRFAFIKGGANLVIPQKEAKVLKVFLEEYVRLAVNEKIGRDVLASQNSGETEEEALEKYPVTDARNPLNLNYNV